MDVMKILINLIWCTVALILASCGGGGGGGVAGSSSSSLVLTGVVAVGAALPSITVTVTDVNGVEATAVTKDDGSYSVYDPSGATLVAPFAIKVVTQMGNSEIKLNSFALDRGLTANVTPLSTAVASLLNGSNSYDPATLNPASVTTQDLNAAIDNLKTALGPLLVSAGVSTSTFDPIKGTFTANSSGVDAVLDSIAITYTSSGITLANRFELSNDSGSSATSISINSFGVTGGTLPGGVSPPSLTTISGFTTKLLKCFSLSANARVGYTTNAGGRDIYTDGSIHADCSTFVDTAYKSQGQEFGQRWLYLLNNADLDSTTKFILVPQFSVDKTGTGWPGDVAFIYNINMIDKNGLTYTMPDVLAKLNGEFVLRGNQRNYDISVQPMISKINDNNGANNFVEGRLRIGLDPTLIPVAGKGTYQYSSINTDKPLPKIMCAWVTGPLLQNGVMHNPDQPRGGVLMVPPHSDLVIRRDYAAIRIKYPTTFDPKNDSNHRRRLLEDCKSYQQTDPNNVNTREIASGSTTNNFTIDKAKTNASSTATFKAYGALGSTYAYPTSLGKVSVTPLTRWGKCPAFTNNVETSGITKDDVDGWCNANYRENFVTSGEISTFNNTYKDPKDIIFTFYLFVDTAYSDANPALAFTSYNATVSANVDSFFNSADIVKNVRIVGTMPFLSKTTDSSNNIIYSGNEAFRSVGDSMKTSYLSANAPTLAKTTSVGASWSIPIGSEGIDRIGLGGWFTKSTGDRIGQATYSDSFPLPRKLLSTNLTLLEDWYGYDSATYKNGQFATPAKYTYREIWVRSYDRYNRQIQTVEMATRAQ